MNFHKLQHLKIKHFLSPLYFRISHLTKFFDNQRIFISFTWFSSSS
nr:MAG TPA: hypothetical protein [Caudoviricetes sp.]